MIWYLLNKEEVPVSVWNYTNRKQTTVREHKGQILLPVEEVLEELNDDSIITENKAKEISIAWSLEIEQELNF